VRFILVHGLAAALLLPFGAAVFLLLFCVLILNKNALVLGEVSFVEDERLRGRLLLLRRVWGKRRLESLGDDYLLERSV
jgi:hypothetical protein